MRKNWWIAAICWFIAFWCAGWAITSLVLGVQPVLNTCTLCMNALTCYFVWGWWKVEKPAKPHTLDEEVEAELYRFRKETGQLD